jgi:hypothetical protein
MTCEWVCVLVDIDEGNNEGVGDDMLDKKIVTFIFTSDSLKSLFSCSMSICRCCPFLGFLQCRAMLLDSLNINSSSERQYVLGLQLEDD